MNRISLYIVNYQQDNEHVTKIMSTHVFMI